jgi:hypothetical protein
MRILSSGAWQKWSRVLQIVGCTGCLTVMIWLIGLIGYYSSTRPYGPSPERCWNVPPHWTHGFYGTYEENQHILRLFDWFFPFFAVLFAGAAIRQSHKKKNLGRGSNFE